MDQTKSKALFTKACDVIPGGVNSPVRAFKSVGGTPPFISHAKGAHIFDVDGNKYVDFIGSWGPMILGHANDEVLGEIARVMEKGTSFGAPTELEITMAEAIIERVPAVDVVRLVNSGTEATMSAIRLARGVTKRDKCIKFNGCYHGHGDSFLIAAGSGATTLGIPNSPGVTKATAQDTLLANFNDIESVKEVFEKYPEDIACVIVEPIAGNMGCIPPQDNFLQDLRTLCSKYNALLIFDEVMTGFRVARGGANELYGVDPDLLCFGKVIGGGLPIGAYGGKRDLMNHVAPAGPVYQAGTLSGNPVAVTAGLETLKRLTPEVYETLEEIGGYMQSKLHDIITKNGYPLSQTRVGSMVCLFFTPNEVRNFADVQKCDLEKFNLFFHEMLKQGVYLAPSQFEAGFLGICHTKEIIDEVAEKAQKALSVVFS
ncbi:glutamate-1-semialdehyde 2,1-aminomutase [Candidatus Uabimicrobium amorphum]|uniref:Glutamate-1-semialdehyde 2,1-aminomutase n=1 Tax=Uabimicrobium amorphum TaxID=2596890 RepID=A0A5S9F4I2_UABAM|nr:glutamate-1-semialdehyde 2,1-aminomutase [Candidatus Uabimicrobium amorphum]BBM85806.1 glutamate-1-semialdehyde 2,1-aminomutase [Candidatus Uabimicrobium amorphum]